MRSLRSIFVTGLMSMLTLSVSPVQAQSAQKTQTQKTQPKVTTKANNKAESPKQTAIKAPADPELAGEIRSQG